MRGERLNDIGLLVDFKDLKAATRKVVEYLDHKDINELPPFDKEFNPSSEDRAGYFFSEVSRDINDERMQVSTLFYGLISYQASTLANATGVMVHWIHRRQELPHHLPLHVANIPVHHEAQIICADTFGPDGHTLRLRWRACCFSS